jgi:hypothetical protein
MYFVVVVILDVFETDNQIATNDTGTNSRPRFLSLAKPEIGAGRGGGIGCGALFESQFVNGVGTK